MLFEHASNPAEAAPRRASARAWRDLLGVLLGTLLAAGLSVHFELSEALYHWTRQRERFEIDEWPGVLLAFAVLLVWFSWRRVGELRLALAQRQAAEQQLSAALAENRRLQQQHVMAQEAERKHLARELHDELGQYLNATQLDAVAVRDIARRCSAGASGAAEPAALASARMLVAAHAIVQNIDHVQRVVGDLMRELRPVALDDLGLVAALEHCVDTWQQRAPHTRIQLRIDGSVEPQDDLMSITLFRLVQEGLTNIAKHAQARQVHVVLRRLPALILVEVQDDGRGADLSQPAAGLGLIGMRERVRALDGSLQFDSQPGQGFRLQARLPWAPKADGMSVDGMSDAALRCDALTAATPT